MNKKGFKMMVRICLFFVCSFLFSTIAFCDQPRIPEDVKLGANFVWQLTQLKNGEWIEEHFRSSEVKKKLNVILDFDDTTIDEIPRIIEAIKRFRERSPLESTVICCDQQVIAGDLGNQSVIYRIQNKRGQVMFFEVHMMGTTTLTIDSVKILSPLEITNRVCGPKMVEVKQN